MRIAIIDDGVATGTIDHPLECYKVSNGRVVSVTTNRISAFSHGTICAKLIERGLKEATLISLSIYSEFSDGIEDDLLTALQWCVDNAIDFVNMSNGVIRFFDNHRLNDVSHLLWQQGTILIAAMSNYWQYTVPAQLPYVIGVARKKQLSRYSLQADVTISGLAIYKNKKGRSQIDHQNSFACARLSNHLALRKQNGRPINKKKFLHKQIYDLSLLKNVYMLCDDGTDIEHTAFSCTRYHGQIIEGQRVTMVITDPYTNGSVLDIISGLANKIGLLVWCHSFMPRTIMRWCKENNIFYWIEPKIYRQKALIRPSSLSFAENTIVVQDHDGAIVDALRLKTRFENEGYHVIVFSDQKQGYLYGMHSSVHYAHIKMVCEEFDPDVIIFIEHDHKYRIDWDLRIKTGTAGLVLTVKERPQEIAFCNIEEIYETLMKILSEEEEA